MINFYQKFADPYKTNLYKILRISGVSCSTSAVPFPPSYAGNRCSVMARLLGRLSHWWRSLHRFHPLIYHLSPASAPSSSYINPAALGCIREDECKPALPKSIYWPPSVGGAVIGKRPVTRLRRRPRKLVTFHSVCSTWQMAGVS